MRLRQNQIGDTIIEVLLAVGIVGLAVAGGYGIANRSLKQARQAQERGEALKLAEGQVEAIKAYVSDDSTDKSLLFNKKTACIDLGSSGSVVSFAFAGSGDDIPAVEDDPLTDYPEPQCVDGLYHVVFDSREVSAGTRVDNYEFTVSVRWVGLGRAGNEEVKINYRAYVAK